MVLEMIPVNIIIVIHAVRHEKAINVPPVDKETRHDTNRQNVPIKNATAIHRKNNSVFLV